MSDNSPNHSINQKNWTLRNPDYSKKYRELHKEEQHKVQKQWRDRNKIRCRASVHRNLDKKKKIVAELKNGPCMDCGQLYPSYVMHFDHRDPEHKFKSISQIMSHGIKTILAEIQKCDLVCANCHAIRTYQGIHSGKIKIFGGIICRAEFTQPQR